LFSHQVFSSHIRAGEITAERISTNSLQFRFTLSLYMKTSSAINQNTAELNFGDGTVITAPMVKQEFLGNDTDKRTYVFNHVFQTVGFYRISFTESWRNDGINNINGSNVSFYLETAIFIDPFVGINNTPVLSVPPIDVAVVGQTFIHNPGAFDIDGDSISYKMTIPKISATQNVPGYRDPASADFGGAGNTLTLNPVSGDLIWEVPRQTGLYNIAFIIEEWRNGIRIGYITRDMQILVEVSNNQKPHLKLPSDTCVAAGSFIDKIITATDSDIRSGSPERIKMTYFGTGQLLISPSTFTVTPDVQSSPASGQYEWQTVCDHVRREPYQVIFKAEDVPPAGITKLTDLKNWFITVMGPKPTGLSATALNREIRLDWNGYTCSKAFRMAIYRKECDSTGYVPQPCDKGLPESLGYDRIAEVPIGTTSFTDNNNGRGLSKGNFYCYIIMAEYPAPGYGTSYPSEEACSGLTPDDPLLTNVTVENTHMSEGIIRVNWINPPVITGSPLYQYRLFRAEGYTGGDYTLIYTSGNINDIGNYDNANNEFVDTGLNTEEKVYNYKIEFLHNGGEIKGGSETASSVSLTGNPGDSRVFINWQYDVPWENSMQYHYVYRKLQDESDYYIKDSVYVIGDRGDFMDSGLVNKDTVCYFIRTVGEYCQEGIPGMYFNDSQKFCLMPRDSIPPCPPILSSLGDCETRNPNYNDLAWFDSFGVGCTNDVVAYNVYYAQYEDEELQLLGSSINNLFRHTDTTSTAGCYAVTSKNYFDMESIQSNKVCVDICVNYKLPNLITPNYDGYNDMFVPIPEIQNVESVVFDVYNRWGAHVFHHEGDVNINWDGNTNQGTVLSDGIYFFNAVVTYKRRLRKEDQIQHMKGWVHITDRGISDE
jgi:gliding motility-associated-like protein